MTKGCDIRPLRCPKEAILGYCDDLRLVFLGGGILSHRLIRLDGMLRNSFTDETDVKRQKPKGASP
jgi:hypothetical protein